MKISAFICALFSTHSMSLVASHPAVIKEEFVFRKPPFASCHASTITETASGTLLCAWFAGTDEGENDVAIWLSVLNDQTWKPPTSIAKVAEVPHWNPVLFTLPTGQVLLFFKAGKNPKEWSGFLQRSNDEGRTWNPVEFLPAGVIGPVKNKPLLLEDGALLCGSSIETYQRWGCWMDITTDEGRTWTKSTPINLPDQLFGIIQPALFFSNEREIRLLARSRNTGTICQAISHDQGKTWSQAHPLPLPNPNAAVDVVNLTDGRILLVYNHTTEGRSPLNIALSSDGGDHWEMVVILEDQPGEYSYPSVIQTKDGMVHVTYTFHRKLIKHVVLDPGKLQVPTKREAPQDSLTISAES